MEKTTKKPKIFTKYQVFVIALLATLQFTVILDFMVLSPLGTILIPELKITTSQFAFVVSAYAFSACISGILTAGFADRFDRKKLLIFFYCGFVIGTFFCALAPTYNYLLAARIFTGLFGGVIGSVGFAIITDLFKMETRGRVMGFVQTAFAASQILGLPLGLFLANKFSWHMPFFAIVGFSVLVVIAIVIFLKPITDHIELNKGRNPFTHLVNTFKNQNYLKAYGATIMLATGGFMLMPFGSTFATNNMGIDVNQLPILYGITGIFSIVIGPIIGKFSDKIGKFKMFLIGSIISMIFVVIYTELGITPLWIAILLNVFLFMGISARMVSSSALLSGVPAPQDRGAFMSINSSIQQLSGALASILAGTIVYQDSSGKLQNYPLLGFVVIATTIATIFLMRMLNRMIERLKRPDKKMDDAGNVTVVHGDDPIV